MALICFLHAAREGLPFFTKCPDPRLLARHEEPFGERGVLFRLSAGLIELIRSVGVAEILEGTAFDATYATHLLELAESLDWSGRPDFVWYNWNQRCTVPMPSGAETETGADGGAAAPGSASVTVAVEDEDAAPAADAVEVSEWPAGGDAARASNAPAGAARSIIETAAPARGGSARVASIQSDSPKGVAPESVNLREPRGAVEISVPTSSFPHISAVTGTGGAQRPIAVPTPSAPQPFGRSSPERLREEAAFTALQNACSFEGATVPSSVEQALLQAREWMPQVTQLKASVTALREASTVAERERIEHHKKLRGVQDILAVVSQRLAAPPTPGATVGLPRAAPDDTTEAPPAKRTRHS